MAEKLVWLPTWHQARLIAARVGVDHNTVAKLWNSKSLPAPKEELSGIYRLILEKLQAG